MIENALVGNHAWGLLEASCLLKDRELSWPTMAGSPAVVEGVEWASSPVCFSGHVQPPESSAELKSPLGSWSHSLAPLSMEGGLQSQGKQVLGGPAVPACPLGISSLCREILLVLCLQNSNIPWPASSPLKHELDEYTLQERKKYWRGSVFQWKAQQPKSAFRF